MNFFNVKRGALSEAEQELLSVGCALRQLNIYKTVRPQRFRENGSAIMRICNVPDCEAFKLWVAVDSDKKAPDIMEEHFPDKICTLSNEELHIID